MKKQQLIDILVVLSPTYQTDFRTSKEAKLHLRIHYTKVQVEKELLKITKSKKLSW